MEPIFLHSSWRAASTYVWAKFREREETYCYFEPLNEHLATATAAFIDGFRPWPYANHPTLHAPYLEEYRPLIEADGGIPGFPAPLCYGRYCGDEDVPPPELGAYLTKLRNWAVQVGRRPVYGFVRTDLRITWFRRLAAAPHIFIYREPRRQFLSMLHQALRGNPYFLQRGLVILHHNREVPAFQPLLSAVDLPQLVARADFLGLLRRGVDDAETLPMLYMIFYFLQRLARDRNHARCDLAIDIDRLSLELEYRKKTEDALGDLTGMTISFADCQVERYDANLAWSGRYFDSLERDIDQLLFGPASA